MTQYVKAATAAEYYHTSISNMRRWASKGTILAERGPKGQYRYIIPKENTSDSSTPIVEHNNISPFIIYARVSSRKQAGDLQRQISLLQKQFPTYTVVNDIGSGINFERKGFKSILEHLFNGTVKKVVVAHNDRFSRFGFEFFQWLFTQFHAELVSMDKNSTHSPADDLTDDIMEIFTVFTARYYGRRKYGNNGNQKTENLPNENSEGIL